MKSFLVVLAAAMISGYAQRSTDKGLVFYDTNWRYPAHVVNEWFRGMTPHGDSYGIVMFRGSAIGPDDYTAAPRGPLIVSFVAPGTDKPASVNRLAFWISNPRAFEPSAQPVPVNFFDSQGRILAAQEFTDYEFQVSVQRIGKISSVEIGGTNFTDLMVSDFDFARPKILHDSTILLSDARQLQNAANAIDFETNPDGTTPVGPISNQWQRLGVIFSDENGNPATVHSSLNLSYWSILDLLRARSGTNAILSYGEKLMITFVDPNTGQPGVVREAGIWAVNANTFWPESTTVQFVDIAGNVLETATSGGKFFFAGARSRKGVARLIITDPDYFLLDDLQFSPVRRVNSTASDDEDSRRAPMPIFRGGKGIEP